MGTLLYFNVSGQEIFLLLAVILLPIYCVFDIISSKFSTQNANILWIIAVLFAPVFGSLIYLLWGRSQKVYI